MEHALHDELTPTPVGTLDAELDALLRQRAKRQRLAKKERLFLCGSTPNALFCVERGIVRLCVTSSNGRVAVLGLVKPGHWFGEASIFTGEARSHDAIAVVDSELLAVPATALHELVDHRPDYLLQFLRLMGLRYKSTLERMDGTILQPLPTRLARKLLEAYRIESLLPGAAPKVLLHLSQEDLGHMLGVSRQSINKVLKQWEERGVVEVSYRSIMLLKPQVLEALA